jgi:hypothetical protein
VPAEQREAVARDIQVEFKKYGDEVLPPLRERAAKLVGPTVGTLLEERFSEDELKQLVAMLESPIFRKYHQVSPELDRALLEKLIADARPVIEPKLRALQDAVGKRLTQAVKPEADSAPAGRASGTAAKPAASGSAAKPAASATRK